MKPLDFNIIRFVLLDIEGTVSDINFVKKVLFPYSAKKLPEYIMEQINDPQIAESLRALDGNSLKDKIQQLLNYINQDIKHPVLKFLQGKVWKTGFENKEFTSPLYADVLPALKKWRESNIEIGIYSSGSVEAQKLFFKHTSYGDLTDYFKYFFDLDIGSKRHVDSYHKICSIIKKDPQSVVFFSDISAELDAAREAHLKTVLVTREAPISKSEHRNICSFNEF